MGINRRLFLDTFVNYHLMVETSPHHTICNPNK